MAAGWQATEPAQPPAAAGYGSLDLDAVLVVALVAAGLGAGGTHAIVGPRVHGGPRGGWRVFQPFSGGSVFVLLQATVRAWA
eukprot:COSAG01_NODE_498_length_16259_cov_11.917512_28_plen_82_part_00